MTFSEKLANAMRDKKVSIRELADKTGIPKSAIQRYTSGDTEKIPIDRMLRMAEALNIDPAYVMGWSDVTAPIRAAFGPDAPLSKQLRGIGEALGASPTDPGEAELVDIYRALNDRGQQTLLDVARGLSATPGMKKDGESNDVTA